jgi:hypothetical protein
MTEAELRRRLREEPAPGEAEGAEGTWALVREAFDQRERVPLEERRWRPVLVFAVIAAVVAAAVTAPGRAVVERIREAVGLEKTEPRLVRLPAGGLLLVDSAHGPWVVHRDGSKRLLGSYDAASWSPHAKFVVATRGRDVVALEPGGGVRWTLTRPHPVSQARWAPSGFRIAYREGSTLRVVIGNGEGDHLLARRVAAVAPAWRVSPPSLNVVAYATRDGTVHVVSVDTGQELWHTYAGSPVRSLLWKEGSLLVWRRGIGHLYDSGGRLQETIDLQPGHVVLGAAFGPSGELVYTDYDPEKQETRVVRGDVNAQAIFRATGRLQDVAWSPNGNWLLVTWPSADEWLFLRTPAVDRFVTVTNVIAQFDPGATGPRAAPRIAGWLRPDG